jgi:hypothetical protein
MIIWLHRPRIPALVALVTVFSISCGGSDANPSAESTHADTQVSQQALPHQTALAGTQGYDCADLLSEQEIDRVIGLSGARRVSGVRGDENDVLPGHTQCGFALPQDFTLGISVYSGAGSGEGLETFDVVWNRAQSQGAEALAGIGESALLQANFPAGSRVLARAKGRGVLVGAGDPEGLGKLNLNDVVKRIAEIVVERV